MMPSFLDSAALFEWCRIPANDLENHSEKKVKVKILKTPEDVHRWVAQDMVKEVKRNNAEGRLTRWILPCGPTGHYPYFIKTVNEERISLKNVIVFHMDNFLDWQGRPLPANHQFDLEGWMRKNFYEPVASELEVPEEQRHFPNVYKIDEISERIREAGGVDTTYGGVGYRGHIAFNEPPRSPWFSISPEEFRDSKTRILNLNDDTLIAQSQRVAGGCSHAVPPMGITLGMKDLLCAKRIRIFSDTGAWKQTVVRILLFGPTTIEYPVTFIQDHLDAMIIVDELTASPPLGV
jgi:glucosamine-6-phosphate deaminase